jgi:hypothetical protein
MMIALTLAKPHRHCIIQDVLYKTQPKDHICINTEASILEADPLLQGTLPVFAEVFSTGSLS